MAALNQLEPASISMGQELAEAAERLQSRTVEIRSADSGRGSGVIWRPDGLVVTNAHVATVSRPTVRLSNGRVCAGKLVDRDGRHDLAFVQIEPTALPQIEVRAPGSLRTGEVLFAIGHPADAAGACAVGILAETPGASDWLVRADIRLAPGYSGGPLCDTQGRIVGINSMIAGGFGVAISAAAVQRSIDHSRPRLGVTLQMVTLPEREMSSFGLMVVELDPGAPAHISGVMVGDVIVAADGERLNSAEQLSDAIAAASCELRLELLRAGRRLECKVVFIRERAAGVA